MSKLVVSGLEGGRKDEGYISLPLYLYSIYLIEMLPICHIIWRTLSPGCLAALSCRASSSPSSWFVFIWTSATNNSWHMAYVIVSLDISRWRQLLAPGRVSTTNLLRLQHQFYTALWYTLIIHDNTSARWTNSNKQTKTQTCWENLLKRHNSDHHNVCTPPWVFGHIHSNQIF